MPEALLVVRRRYLIVVVPRSLPRCASQVLGRGAQTDARGAAQVLDRGAQAVSRGSIRYVSKVLDRCAQAAARGAASCRRRLLYVAGTWSCCPGRCPRRRGAVSAEEELNGRCAAEQSKYYRLYLHSGNFGHAGQGWLLRQRSPGVPSDVMVCLRALTRTGRVGCRRPCASFPPSSVSTAMSVFFVARWRSARGMVEWICTRERWNPEVAIIFGAAAR
jgi:hypothetical protein